MSSPLTLECPPATSETGAFKISWGGGAEGAGFELRENGEILYAGGESATTVTGRPAGRYEYTVQAGEAASEEPCVVEVAPPSLELAFTLFAVGFVVFAATLALIVTGYRRDGKESAGS